VSGHFAENELIETKWAVRFSLAWPFLFADAPWFACMAGQGRIRTIKAIDFAI